MKHDINSRTRRILFGSRFREISAKREKKGPLITTLSSVITWYRVVCEFGFVYGDRYDFRDGAPTAHDNKECTTVAGRARHDV